MFLIKSLILRFGPYGKKVIIKGQWLLEVQHFQKETLYFQFS